MWRTHSWLGLAFSLYIVIVGLTGAVLVFTPQLDQQRNAVYCAASGPLATSPDDVLAQVRGAYSGWRILTLTFPHERCGNWNAFVLRGREEREIYVDAATGRVVGARSAGDGWLIHLHGELLLGRAGQRFSGIAILGLLVSIGTGLVLWRGNWRSRWHRWTGIASAALLTPMLLTGLYFVMPGVTVALVSKLLPRSPAAPQVAPAGPLLPWRQLQQAAQTALPGRSPFRLEFPATPQSALRITFRENHVDRFHEISSVYLDPYSGGVLRSVPLEQRPAGDSLIGWLSAFHFGVFGGLPLQLLWGALGLATAFLGASGFWLSWRRWQSKK